MTFKYFLTILLILMVADVSTLYLIGRSHPRASQVPIESRQDQMSDLKAQENKLLKDKCTSLGGIILQDKSFNFTSCKFN